MSNGQLHSKWERLNQDRSSKLERLREGSRYTDPNMLPDEGVDSNSELPTPLNSVPNDAAQSLSGQIYEAFAPVTDAPIFSFDLSSFEVDMEPEEFAAFKDIIFKIERTIWQRAIRGNYRTMAFDVAQNLVYHADTIFRIMPKNKYRVYRVDNFVLERSIDGFPHCAIIREWYDVTALPEFLQPYSDGTPTVVGNDRSTVSEPNWVPLFIKVNFEDGESKSVEYEFNGHTIPENEIPSELASPKGAWSVVSYKVRAGETYAVCPVENSLGDMRSLHSLTLSMLQLSAASAYFLIGVNPNGYARIGELNKAINGQFVSATRDDIFGVSPDLRTNIDPIRLAKQELEKSIMDRFLVFNSSELTDRDRVTAFEVSQHVRRSRNVLIGPFASISSNFLLPIIHYHIQDARTKGIFRSGDFESQELQAALALFWDAYDKNRFGLVINTGLQSLHREQEQATLSNLMAQWLQLPQDAQDAINWPEVIRAQARAYVLDDANIVRSRQEQLAIRQARINEQVQTAAAQEGAAAVANQAIQNQGIEE